MAKHENRCAISAFRLLRAAALACVLAAAGAAAGHAADFATDAVGTAGSEFLNIDHDPRGIGMGSAFSAVTDDVHSLYWNPAGLASIPRVSASAVHNEYFAGIRMQYFAYAQRVTDISVVGGAVRYMDAGAIDNTDINGTKIGDFRPRNYVWEIGWAQSITDLADAERDVTLGVTGRYLQSDMIAKARAFAGDVGMQIHYSDAFIPWNFAAVAQNLGKGQKFDEVRDTLPFRARLGLSLQPRPFLLLAMEGVFPVSNHPYMGFGGEFAIDTVKDAKPYVRAGFNTRNQFNGLDGLRGMSFGLGLRMRDLSFDYAFAPFGALGNTHRFAVSWDLPAKHSRRFRQR